MVIRRKRVAKEKKEDNNSDPLPEKIKEQETKIDQAINRAKRWLISRYNLTKVREIAYKAHKPEPEDGKDIKRQNRFKWYLSNCLPEILAGMIIILLVLFFSTATRNWPGKLDIPYINRVLSYFKWDITIDTNSIVLLLYVILAVPIFWKLLGSKGKELDFQVHLPRMAAGIIVGYLVLLNDEAWGGIFSENTIFSVFNPDISTLFPGFLSQKTRSSLTEKPKT